MKVHDLFSSMAKGLSADGGKVESAVANIIYHLNDLPYEEMENTRSWLEGWICGVTDPILNPGGEEYREKLLIILKHLYMMYKELLDIEK